MIAPSGTSNDALSDQQGGLDEELEKLAALRDREILTDEEFQQQKALILSRQTTRG